MPNKQDHADIGGVAGLVIASLLNAASQAEKKRADPFYQFNPAEFAGAAAVGYGLGRADAVLPDLLEPATHPGHWDLFHSVAAGVAIGYGLHTVNKNAGISPAGKLLLNTAGAGYLSHLVLDGRTPAGLPLLTKK